MVNFPQYGYQETPCRGNDSNGLKLTDQSSHVSTVAVPCPFNRFCCLNGIKHGGMVRRSVRTVNQPEVSTPVFAKHWNGKLKMDTKIQSTMDTTCYV
ncbi:hypothetical protein AVEN_4544-1 [Araneus ventricosus]|uniref:Uncharacterized protein n=1 Tax=Araneus ventricosus TaxID=182803 RepID=A0A4Y2BKU0_ARAVE|nr:hypothetical protein AVEN_4544-1 [Araneus ventricosus]